MGRWQALAPPPALIDPRLLSGLDLPATGGTYGLGLALPAETQIRVGALDTHLFPAGLYLYVGSAWGSGGLRARVGRHLAGSGALRWHIDYVRHYAHPVGLWLAPGGRLECAWARWLTSYPAAQILVPRFGASDCACDTHLFLLEDAVISTLDLPADPHYVNLPTGSPCPSGLAG